SVTINSTGFTTAAGVTFNGTSASFTINSDIKITATVPTGATTGKIAVTAGGGNVTSAGTFTVTSGGGSGTVVISQVYGGGGNSGATYKNDFIELFNRSANAIDLTGWSVQYSSAAGTTWQRTPLTNVILQPGQYYLVQ